MRPQTLFSLCSICILLMLHACAPAPVTTPAATPLPSTIPTLPPSPSATPTPSAADCLVGDWQISPETVQSLLIYITAVPSLQVMDGALYLKFDGTNFAYHATGLALRSSFMDSYLDAKADILIEGTYLAEDGSLRFTQVNTTNKLYDWTVVKGDYVRPFQGSSPVVPFEIAGEVGYTCSSDSLQLKLADQSGEILIDLVRVN